MNLLTFTKLKVLLFSVNNLSFFFLRKREKRMAERKEEKEEKEKEV